jgi:glyoxylase-like metal-dependent hydrolase (beta-lactamase superfamily II)
MKAHHQCFTGGVAQTNGYLVPCDDGSHLLIDAPDGVVEWIAQLGVIVSAALLTHQHFDHVIDAAALQASGVKIYAFAEASELLTLDHTIKQWGLPPIAPYRVDKLLQGRSSIELHGQTIHLAHVPGHSPDSLIFHFPLSAQLYSGDTLIAGSIGRTDIPGHGDHKLLLRGIRENILTMPEDTAVHPGHGSSTSIAQELRHNPYLA